MIALHYSVHSRRTRVSHLSEQSFSLYFLNVQICCTVSLNSMGPHSGGWRHQKLGRGTGDGKFLGHALFLILLLEHTPFSKEMPPPRDFSSRTLHESQGPSLTKSGRSF